MTRDNKRAPLDDDDDFGGESHAADEPTAVWDENALRAAGLTDLLKRRTDDAPETPASTPAPTGDAPSIVVDQSVVDQHGAVQPVAAPRPAPTRQSAAPPAPSTGLGWGATLGIALALGLVVYFLIRYLKG